MSSEDKQTEEKDLEVMRRILRLKDDESDETLQREFAKWELIQNEGLREEGVTLRQKYGISPQATPLEVIRIVKSGRLAEPKEKEPWQEKVYPNPESMRN